MYCAFLGVAISAGVPPMLAALLLGFDGAIFSSTTHYANGPSSIMFGSGYVTQNDWWKMNMVLGIFYLLVWGGVGTLWMRVIGMWWYGSVSQPLGLRRYVYVQNMMRGREKRAFSLPLAVFLNSFLDLNQAHAISGSKKIGAALIFKMATRLVFLFSKYLIVELVCRSSYSLAPINKGWQGSLISVNWWEFPYFDNKNNLPVDWQRPYICPKYK